MQARPPLHPLARTHTYIEGWLGSVTECKHSPFVFFPFISHSFLLLPFVLHRHPEVLRASDKAPRGPKSYLTLTADRLSTREVTLSNTHQTHLFPPSVSCFLYLLLHLFTHFTFVFFIFFFHLFFSRHKPISHTDCHLQIDVLLLMLHSVWSLWLTLVWNLRKRIRTTGRVDTPFFFFSKFWKSEFWL